MNLSQMDVFLRYIIYISIIFGTIIWFVWVFKNKWRYKYAIAPLFFLFHSGLFSVLGAFGVISREIYIIWRNLIFIHALSILITAGLVMIRTTEEKK